MGLGAGAIHGAEDRGPGPGTATAAAAARCGWAGAEVSVWTRVDRTEGL